ncbi:unnamed protein product [Microthlaspi erraticum]|uniref:Uncharacterized protein n=1 Tax=Microthlaspi erraticum TaxID=1685480 RepID=A0A6D2K324_9BRAS|nr:unnamed protein product [Microthlaspi erraticum]
MSPLVIARNQASCQNLVDSTKIERIKTDSKSAHRKEKKEERRKHKKEKHEKSKSKSHNHSVSNESELEKSGLTEELPQNLHGYDSDGSQNSKKRKRDNSPPAVESLVKAAPVAGKPLRIRLIFKKPKADDSPSLPREDPLACSTPVAESLKHSEKIGQDVVTSSVPCSKVSVLEENSVPCSKVSELEENLPSTSAAEARKRKKHRPSKEERYNALFDDWTPSICFPAMEVDSSSKNDEDDWLFGNRAQEKSNPKVAAKIDEDMSLSLHSRGDSSWPRVQFLPEVGIYSLPYTVPF